MTTETYIHELRDALRTEGAHSFYFPPGKELRRDRNFRLAREVGWGLQNSPDAESIIQSLYGMLVVANSLDTTGVCVDAKEWFAELRRSIHSL